ncbi:ATP-binding protein, partial [Streptomyces sp. MBT53]|nr:ATP-binding protein [Streptomyces sp. MBT53]
DGLVPGHQPVPDVGGLPRRRRRTPVAAANAQAAPAVPVAPAQPEWRPEQAAAALGALQSATAAARAASDGAGSAVDEESAGPRPVVRDLDQKKHGNDYEGGAAR